MSKEKEYNCDDFACCTDANEFIWYIWIIIDPAGSFYFTFIQVPENAATVYNNSK